MDDLFPASWHPDALGADLIPYLRPVFFALYPAEGDLPGLAGWQRRLCGEQASTIKLRPAELLHVSVADCGKPRRRRQLLPEALAEARGHFSFPAFDMVFDSIGRFGADDRACVAIADARSHEFVTSLRIAIANAQRHVGLFASRSKVHRAHLTLGYANDLPPDIRSVQPFGFRARTVELVASDSGKSRHLRLASWALEGGS